MVFCVADLFSAALFGEVWRLLVAVTAVTFSFLSGIVRATRGFSELDSCKFFMDYIDWIVVAATYCSTCCFGDLGAFGFITLIRWILPMGFAIGDCKEWRRLILILLILLVEF